MRILFAHGSKHRRVTDADDCNNDVENGDDNGTSTVSGSSEQGEEDTRNIDFSCLPSMVTWETTDGEQSTQNLHLDLYLDSSTNSAFFKLYGRIFLKKFGKDNKQAIYLFIYPENVQTITWETASHFSRTRQDTGHSLCLSMSKPPDLVIPKNRPLEPKNNTQNLLNSILALAKATTFTAYFSDKETDPGTRQQLASVASVFSERRHNRLLVNKERANLTTLYAGIGGQIFDFNPKPSSEVAPPPSYNKVALSSGQPRGRKRRRTSDPSSDDSEPVLSLLKTMNNKLDNLGIQLDNLDSRLTRLEEQASSTHRPCRYGTEERADLLQNINEQLEDSVLDIQLEMRDDLNGVISEAREDIEQLKNGAPEIIKQLVDESVKDVLDNANVELKGEVSLKFKM
ncbi:hypothetical protein BKA56DRAFT_241627 [Ilyonectria sp. MPI-CAGE-AT-0026]|nr:hypothetical protein BKA56DRAFT_241627 [Ilyonectria sp. MPI-CAGE-AT-0026]